jgi:hypothetical protein
MLASYAMNTCKWCKDNETPLCTHMYNEHYLVMVQGGRRVRTTWARLHSSIFHHPYQMKHTSNMMINNHI